MTENRKDLDHCQVCGEFLTANHICMGPGNRPAMMPFLKCHHCHREVSRRYAIATLEASSRDLCPMCFCHLGFCNSPEDQKHEAVYKGVTYRICSNCHDEIYRDYKLRRKAQLDAMPRCEVPGCARRANYRIAKVGLCGRHKSAAVRSAAKVLQESGMAAFVMFGGFDFDRTDILAWAAER